MLLQQAVAAAGHRHLPRTLSDSMAAGSGAYAQFPAGDMAMAAGGQQHYPPGPLGVREQLPPGTGGPWRTASFPGMGLGAFVQAGGSPYMQLPSVQAGAWQRTQHGLVPGFDEYGWGDDASFDARGGPFDRRSVGQPPAAWAGLGSEGQAAWGLGGQAVGGGLLRTQSQALAMHHASTYGPAGDAPGGAHGARPGVPSFQPAAAASAGSGPLDDDLLPEERDALARAMGAGLGDGAGPLGGYAPRRILSLPARLQSPWYGVAAGAGDAAVAAGSGPLSASLSDTSALTTTADAAGRELLARGAPPAPRVPRGSWASSGSALLLGDGDDGDDGGGGVEVPVMGVSMGPDGGLLMVAEGDDGEAQPLAVTPQAAPRHGQLGPLEDAPSLGAWRHAASAGAEMLQLQAAQQESELAGAQQERPASPLVFINNGVVMGVDSRGGAGGAGGAHLAAPAAEAGAAATLQPHVGHGSASACGAAVVAAGGLPILPLFQPGCGPPRSGFAAQAQGAESIGRLPSAPQLGPTGQPAAAPFVGGLHSGLPGHGVARSETAPPGLLVQQGPPSRTGPQPRGGQAWPTPITTVVTEGRRGSG